jgi:hypothetical protein
MPEEKPPSKIKGKALRRTRGQLKALARIEAADIDLARADWRRKTLPGWGELIEAERIR